MNDPYQYVSTYVCLKLGDLFAPLPVTVEHDGQTLQKKDGFHATILCGSDLFSDAEAATGIHKEEAEKRLLDLFEAFVEERPIRLESLSQDFRFVPCGKRENERNRMSIIVRARLRHIDDFFSEVNAAFGTAIPVQPAHVTLYTSPKNAGVTIASDAEMAQLRRIQIPALSALDLFARAPSDV